MRITKTWTSPSRKRYQLSIWQDDAPRWSTSHKYWFGEVCIHSIILGDDEKFQFFAESAESAAMNGCRLIADLHNRESTPFHDYSNP